MDTKNNSKFKNALANLVEHLENDAANNPMSKTMAVFWRGIMEGFQAPDELSLGGAYETYQLNNVYDTGVNLGQMLGSKAKE